MTGRMAVLLLISSLASTARAQIDGSRRLLLEAGYEDGLANPGPSSPYAFLYLNRPGIAGPGSALRLAVAPVYVDAELGLPGSLGSRTDVGLGLSGGGYAFGHSEVNRGNERKGEAFIGHGGGPSVSLYPRIGDIGPVPVNGVVRGALSYIDYQRASSSDASFEPPPDQWAFSGRAGIRAGGIEPGLAKGRAVELSLWTESLLRAKPGTYGYNGDRSVSRAVSLLWTRLHVSLPGPLETRVSGGIGAGTGASIGRLAAYRLGGMTTQTSEFPLILPGYFSREISAKRYVHAWAHTALPLRGSDRFFLDLTAAGASVAPVAGTDPGPLRPVGLSAGVSFVPKDGGLSGILAYGYAPTALRGSRHGGHSFAFNVELDFLAPAEKPAVPYKTRQQGLRWLFGPGL